MDLQSVKDYCRIDYDDDDELLLAMTGAAEQELSDSIGSDNFDPDSPTKSQKIIIFAMVQDMYDNRGLDSTNRGYSRMVNSLIQHAKWHTEDSS